MNNYNNKDCISLVIQELETNPSFLPMPYKKIKDYLIKIDQHSIFQKQYVDNQLAGFVSFYCNNEKTKEAFITLVLINNNFRGKKIAQKLLKDTISNIREKKFSRCSLEVNIENKNALHLYEKIGFYEVYKKDDSIFMSITV